MTETSSKPFDPESVVDAMAAMLCLEVKPDFRPGVVANLRITAALAKLVLDFPLGDHADPAPVYAA